MPRKTKPQLESEQQAAEQQAMAEGDAPPPETTDSMVASTAPEHSSESTPEPEMLLTVLENSQVFKWNFDEIKSRLLAGIEKYTGLTVTDENLPDMERTQREIASLRTQVNKFRIETKKQLTATADKFDGEVKELTAIIAAAEAPLKKQIEEYEVVRVQKCETSLLQFAWKYASASGMRSDVFATYQVPSKLTQRSTSDKTAKTEVIASMDALLESQRQADAAAAEKIRLEQEAAKRESEKRALIGILCESRSREAGLKTPLTAEEFERANPLSSVAGIDELPGIIGREVERRRAIEDAAAAPPAPPPILPPTPELNQPPVTPRPPAPPPPCAPAQLPPVSYGPPPTDPKPRYDVVLKFPGVTVVQAGELKLWLSDHKMTYQVISQDKVVTP